MDSVSFFAGEDVSLSEDLSEVVNEECRITRMVGLAEVLGNHRRVGWGCWSFYGNGSLGHCSFWHMQPMKGYTGWDQQYTLLSGRCGHCRGKET